MAWWNGRRKNKHAAVDTRLVVPSRDDRVLTAAAQTVNTLAQGRTRVTPKYDGWQRELWDYYDTLGEFNISVTWRSYMISRVRLRAAKLKPGSDEPEIVDSGPAADLVNELCGGTARQTEMLGSLSVYLDVPAEGWLVGETVGSRQKWRVISSDEIRRRGRNYEVIADDSTEADVHWRDLPQTTSYVTRIWRPHKRLHYLPYSSAYAARSAMRELELVNRHIQAQYLSRLASAGLIIFPDEITFPVRPEFMNEPDPFIREWIETAAEAIKNPGSASSLIPLPIRVPAEYVEKVKHVDFTLKMDDRIIEKRDSARNRLASMINVPADLLFQAGDVNHWGLWQLEEGAIRTYITPDVEIITSGLTTGYLHPRMRALGIEDYEDWVIWYDASELMVRPDKSDNAKDAYDRLELSGTALRREVGFDEDDAPDDTELANMILKKLATNPTLAIQALEKLTGIKLEQPPTQTPVPAEGPVVTGGNASGDDSGASSDGPPKTEDDKPPAPGELAAELERFAIESTLPQPIITGPVVPGPVPFETLSLENRAFAIMQAGMRHVMEFTMDSWRLKHPLICMEKQFSCPFTHATYEGVRFRPGTKGDYECFLTDQGELSIGQRLVNHDDARLVANPRKAINGTRLGS
jgi:hypothetical protein